MKFSSKNITPNETEDLLKVWQITPSDKIPEIDVAIAEFSGNRYPKEGTSRNLVSTMLYIVKEGRANITIDDEKFTVGKGDVLAILPNKKYWVEPEKGFSVYIVSTPAWNAKQYVVE